jgi:DNA-binding PadR family transcriptional regulator
VRSKSETLEFAILGLLAQGPLHGYELRKRIMTIFGPFRGLAFSVLYPQLHRMLEGGTIQEMESENPVGRSRRKRIVYAITSAGKTKFESSVTLTDPETWDDENFEIRFAFFGPTPVGSRLRILEGRLRRLTEKSALLRADLESSQETAGGKDKYLTEWRRHSLDAADREIAWLQDMIKIERKSA